MVLELKPRASSMLNVGSTLELHPQPAAGWLTSPFHLLGLEPVGTYFISQKVRKTVHHVVKGKAFLLNSNDLQWNLSSDFGQVPHSAIM